MFWSSGVRDGLSSSCLVVGVGEEVDLGHA